MGKIINSYILPHPPIIVPGIGRGKEIEAINTIEAVKKAAKDISNDKPTTIILSTPHAPSFKDHVYITDTDNATGNFAAFGYPEIMLKFQNNTELVSAITERVKNIGISAGGVSSSIKEKYGISDLLDHGALVPLYFISKELDNFKIVHISTPFLPSDELYNIGKCIADAVNSSNENVVYIASGDLSHRLTEDAPSGYNPKGKEYDEYLIRRLKEKDVKGLLNTDEEFMELAGECGTRSIMMMLGTLNGLKTEIDIYSYEGPFGVGYLVAKLSVLVVNEGDAISESNYVKLARETLEAFIRENKRIPVPNWLPPEFFKHRAGVFVSLKKNGQLRGCIGTIGPTMRNIAEEIMNNAISSGTKDPRFDVVTEGELSELEYSVDVLGAPEKIHSKDELDIKKYGVIVSSEWRRGLLLPDLDGIDTPEEQVSIALQKAGIQSFEQYDMERFEVIRYH